MGRSPEAMERRREYARQRSRCKYAEDPEAVKEANRKYLATEKGRENYRSYMKDYQKDRRRELKAELVDLAGGACIHCGEDHPACLDFHHRDPEQKTETVGRMISCGYKKDTILLEIAKCDLVCSNCHRKIHFDMEIRVNAEEWQTNTDKELN